MRTLTTLSRGIAAVGTAGLLSLGFAATATAEPKVDNPNTAEYWEALLTEDGFENVDCTKIHDGGLDSDEWESDGDYLLVVLKAGSDQSSEGDPNTVYDFVEEGDVLSTEDGKDISHIITCVGDEPEEPTGSPTPTPTPTSSNPGSIPTPTGPIVETDIVETSATPAILGGAAVLAGLGLAGAVVRRKGQH